MFDCTVVGSLNSLDRYGGGMCEDIIMQLLLGPAVANFMLYKGCMGWGWETLASCPDSINFSQYYSFHIRCFDLHAMVFSRPVPRIWKGGGGGGF